MGDKSHYFYHFLITQKHNTQKLFQFKIAYKEHRQGITATAVHYENSSLLISIAEPLEFLIFFAAVKQLLQLEDAVVLSSVGLSSNSTSASSVSPDFLNPDRNCLSLFIYSINLKNYIMHPPRCLEVVLSIHHPCLPQVTQDSPKTQVATLTSWSNLVLPPEMMAGMVIWVSDRCSHAVHPSTVCLCAFKQVILMFRVALQLLNVHHPSFLI